jgi:hypothetical protein
MVCRYIMEQDVMKRLLVHPANIEDEFTALSLVCQADAWIIGLTPKQEVATPPVRCILTFIVSDGNRAHRDHSISKAFRLSSRPQHVDFLRPHVLGLH